MLFGAYILIQTIFITLNIVIETTHFSNKQAPERQILTCLQNLSPQNVPIDCKPTDHVPTDCKPTDHPESSFRDLLLTLHITCDENTVDPPKMSKSDVIKCLEPDTHCFQEKSDCNPMP